MLNTFIHTTACLESDSKSGIISQVLGVQLQKPLFSKQWQIMGETLLCVVLKSHCRISFLRTEFSTVRCCFRYLRYVIFTMEVAVATMAPGVDQWILILDAGGKIHMFLFFSYCTCSPILLCAFV